MGAPDSDTLFLAAMPSTLSGVARNIDLGGVFDSYNSRSTPAEADDLAIAQDWVMVGNGLRQSIDSYVEEYRAALQGE